MAVERSASQAEVSGFEYKILKFDSEKNVFLF